MKRSAYGFTIVELLIVIVVIGILASITIIAYNGVQGRAEYTRIKSDFSTLQKALEMYKSDHGDAYPNSADCVATAGEANYEHQWCGWNQGVNDSFIPGIAPRYIATTPTLSKRADTADTYLYKSSSGKDGLNPGTAYYQILRFKRSGLTSTEVSEATKDGTLVSGSYVVNGNETAWGLKSDPTLAWW